MVDGWWWDGTTANVAAAAGQIDLKRLPFLAATVPRRNIIRLGALLPIRAIQLIQHCWFGSAN